MTCTKSRWVYISSNDSYLVACALTLRCSTSSVRWNRSMKPFDYGRGHRRLAVARSPRVGGAARRGAGGRGGSTRVRVDHDRLDLQVVLLGRTPYRRRSSTRRRRRRALLAGRTRPLVDFFWAAESALIRSCFGRDDSWIRRCLRSEGHAHTNPRPGCGISGATLPDHPAVSPPTSSDTSFRFWKLTQPYARMEHRPARDGLNKSPRRSPWSEPVSCRHRRAKLRLAA